MRMPTMVADNWFAHSAVMTARWLSTAPLARPVVPLVNNTMAGASGSANTQGRRSATGAGGCSPSAALVSKRVQPAGNGSAASSMTTPRTPGRRSCTAPRRKARLASATTSRQCVLAKPWSISSGAPRLFTSTGTAPSAETAMNATSQSGLLASANPTNSPPCKPSTARRCSANPAARANTSP